MKTKILLLVIFGFVVLSGSLYYENVRNNQVRKRHEQTEITAIVALYRGLERGDVDGVKTRLGALVAFESDRYAKLYGQETNTEFARELAKAKTIKAEYKVMVHPSSHNNN